MKLKRLAFLASTVSVGVVVVIFLITGVSLTEILNLGLTTFTLAAAASIARVLLQGMRFHIVSSGLSEEHRQKGRQSVIVRAASEFVALISLTYGGDELVRITWLSKRGVESGRAAWIAFSELYFDALVGLSLAVIAAAYVWQLGGAPLAIAIVAISAPALLASALVAWYLVKGSPTLPGWMGVVFQRALGPGLGSRAMAWAERAIVNFSAAARELFSSAGATTTVAALVVTILIHLLPGVSLWVIAEAARAGLGLLPAILTAQAGETLGTLPVTVGGSGLTEAGVALYLNRLLGAQFWSGILVWRVATYHVPLVICAIAFLRLVQVGILSRKMANSKESG